MRSSDWSSDVCSSDLVARLIQKQLAGRLSVDNKPIPLIAETGGQNAMIVDSSALAEQVVADVIASAFDSAGQRCRSEERRVGNECVRTCRYRWWTNK